MQYIVKPGDNLSLIARANGTTVATLMRINPEIEDANQISPAQTIRLPASSNSRQTRHIGQIADTGECTDEYVDLLHQAKDGLLVPLTIADQREIEQEEAVLDQLIRQFHAAMEEPEESILGFKDNFIERLQQEKIIDASNPSEPIQLTEIRRLKGNNHYAYVRKNSGWRRHRSYKIDAQDRARRQGWFDPASGRVSPDKLVENIARDLKTPQFKLAVNQSFVDWCLREWRSDPIKWTPVEGMQPIVVGSQAQALRFAVGANLQAGYDPKTMSTHIAAKASASASLVEAKAYASSSWPAEEDSEWVIYYLDQSNLRQAASLGKFRAQVRTELAGFAGASAILSANVHIEMKDGKPQLRGTGKSNPSSSNGQPDSAEASLFAGVRTDGKLEGAIEWQDTLATQPEWKALCTLGVGAGVALGLGAEAQLKLKWSKETYKFYFNMHAGLVAGAGASGELGAEVDAGTFLAMIKCVYNALLTVDFRKIHNIDETAFNQLTNFAVFGILTGAGYATVAVRLGMEAADEVAEDIQRIIKGHAIAVDREKLAISTADNVLSDLNRSDQSWIKYAPPEVKGRLLNIICYDYALTPFDLYTLGSNSRERAILALLEASQCWRDYEETVTRMTTNGDKGNFAHNRTRLRNVMRAVPGLKLDIIEKALSGTRAVPDQPVQLAKHIQLSGIQYA